MAQKLRVNWIACEGRGMCMDTLPELIEPDDWGYPMIDPRPVPPELESLARRTVEVCPVLALRLETVPD
jgi:ferredoxin